jgi:hypothetical protein
MKKTVMILALVLAGCAARGRTYQYPVSKQLIDCDVYASQRLHTDIQKCYGNWLLGFCTTEKITLTRFCGLHRDG